ncbi:MAG TPA: ABC transporter ATP-binding protein [Stellaceae bacterium]|nr:ABC transporter ATP-binding protein [Stellaceae bacterium]
MIEAPAALMRVENLVVSFTNPDRFGKGSTFRVIDGVAFDLNEGEVFGIVGESGSGKTTLGKTILRLYRPQSGRIFYKGIDITTLGEAGLRPYRRNLQMIFQDPLTSFNPLVRIGDALQLPFHLHRLCGPSQVPHEVDRLLTRVGLSPGLKDRYPHELSGGQLQRIAIARVLALRPRLIVADEPVSKLDVSVRAQILNLFREIQKDVGISLVFVTHDLRVARYLCDRVAVMFFGRLVEIAPTEALFERPLHPYTQQLIGTLAETRGDDAAIEPAPPADATGCRYRSRCARADGACAVPPPLIAAGAHHIVACHHSRS